jgi:tetratricopeptide (TPR) repeat protein
VQALDVASRTSAFAFRSTNEDIREIGRRLEVRTVLEGSVRKSASRLRVTAQLIDVLSGYHLWSERYDRQIADVFDIQDEIAENIVKALRVVLTAREHLALKKAATRDVRAYEYYLRGRHLYHQHGRANYEQARELFRRAIEIDPNYALAYAGIANLESFHYMYLGGEEHDVEEADSASRRALELDPSAAEAHASRGLALTLTGRYQEAESELAEAMRLDPTLSEAPYFFGRAALAQGKYAVAVEMWERAAALRPDDYQPVFLSVPLLEKLGRPEEAAKASLRGLALIERAVEINPGDQRALCFGVGILLRLGDSHRAEEWTARVLALSGKDPGTLYNLACAQATVGHTKEALELLEHATACGFAHLDWVVNDPDLISLHGDPKYEQIVTTLKNR